MLLETYISDLLYRYDCVIVPEFGAFLSHRISAQINKDQHLFFPPKKRLSFNGQIQHNDGLLCNHVAEVEKIPYTKAIEEVQKALAARLASTVIGNPSEEGVRMGALATRTQVDRVRENVDLLSKSQDIVFGDLDNFDVKGADKDKGAFFSPI